MASDVVLDDCIKRVAEVVAAKLRQIIADGGGIGDITVIVRGDNVDVIGGPRERVKLVRRPH